MLVRKPCRLLAGNRCLGRPRELGCQARATKVSVLPLCGFHKQERRPPIGRPRGWISIPCGNSFPRFSNNHAVQTETTSKSNRGVDANSNPRSDVGLFLDAPLRTRFAARLRYRAGHSPPGSTMLSSGSTAPLFSTQLVGPCESAVYKGQGQKGTPQGQSACAVNTSGCSQLAGFKLNRTCRA